jgi:acyl carrier protein
MDTLNLRIKELITERLNLRISPAEIRDEVPIFSSDDGGLGLDSIDALDLAVGLFEEFQVEIGEKDMHIFQNVNTITSFVRNAQQAKGEVLEIAAGAA